MDETVQVQRYPAAANPTKPIPGLQHNKAIKCILPLCATPLAEPYLITGSGDAIRVYDISTLDEPELVAEFDAHSHDVTSLAYWMRPGKSGRGPEIWIVSASLDGTLRKWKLVGM
jgi:WD40 repeat protein